MRGNVAEVPRRLRPYAPAALVVVVQLVWFPVPAGVWVLGLVLGLLGALVALGLALVQRANHVLNFAQADLGALPVALAYGLVVFWGVPYLLAATVGLAAAVVLGGLVEFLVVRRFFRAPRLVLTVATIGLSQLLLVLSLLVPRLWGKALLDPVGIHVPGNVHLTIAPVLFGPDAFAAVLGAVVCIVALGLFLARSDVGVAVRASAERADRAAMLGVPVKRLTTLVWVVATVLSFVGLFLRASLLGLALNPTLSLGLLLGALTALVLGADDLPAVALSAVALGVLEQGVLWHASRRPTLVYAAYAVVVLVALLMQRRGNRRADLDATATWLAATDPRAIPPELAVLPEVRAARAGLLVAAAALVVWMGATLGPANLLKASGVACICLVTLSIVVLTGWAGQVSLGQMAFAAVGGVVGAVAVATWGWDLSLALLAAATAGAVVAVLVGLPAIRLRGSYLTVASLAFSLATTGFILNRNTFAWIPRDRIDRPHLFGVWDVTAPRTMFAVCVGTALLGVIAVRRLRLGRTGRVLRAVRTNERAAQSYGVRATWAKIEAFAVSGALAAMAGCLLVVLTQQYSETPFTAEQSVAVFTAAVVGGVASIAGAVIGALFSKGGTWFLTGSWQLLPSAVGVLGVLLLLPGGLVEFGFRLRDGFLRRVAARRGIEVPSLVADRRVVEQPLVVPTALGDLGEEVA